MLSRRKKKFSYEALVILTLINFSLLRHRPLFYYFSWVFKSPPWKLIGWTLLFCNWHIYSLRKSFFFVSCPISHYVPSPSLSPYSSPYFIPNWICFKITILKCFFSQKITSSHTQPQEPRTVI